VTVGREADKVKPNGKKRMNLRAVAHPPGGRPVTWSAAEKPYLGGV
jgi:surface antigen